MADSDQGVSSWPGFVDQLNKTFMLVRDVFGYTFPGGVFFVVGLITGKISLAKISSWLQPWQPRGWAAAFLAVWAAYIMGHVLVTIVYLPIDLLKCYYAYRIKHARNHQEAKEYTAKLESVPTEVTAPMLTIRESHPGFFGTLDRRETMAMLAGATGGALVVGTAIFGRPWDYSCWMLALVGVALLLDFATAMPHLQRVREAIIAADRAMKPPPPPHPSVEEAVDNLLKAVNDAMGNQ